MHQQIEGFVHRIRYRNWQETVAAAFVALFFGSQLIGGSPLSLDGLGRIVILLGAGWVVFALWRWLSIPSRELVDYPPEQHPDHWRRRMTTQAVGLKWAWLWYAAPLMLGASFVTLGAAESALEAAIFAGTLLVVTLVLGWINRVAGRGIEADRDRWFPPESAMPSHTR